MSRALKACFNGCPLPLLHPHTPINTEASIHYQHRKYTHENIQHTQKLCRRIHNENHTTGEQKTLELRCPKVISIFISSQAQKPRSKVPTSRKRPNRKSNLLVRKGKLSNLVFRITYHYSLLLSIFHPRQDQRAWVWHPGHVHHLLIFAADIA